MSDLKDDFTVRDMEREASDRSGVEQDVLKQHEEWFEDFYDVFKGYLTSRRFEGVGEETLNQWELTFGYWQDWMEAQGRHPACPNEYHIEDFYKWCQTEKRIPDSKPVAGKRIIHLRAVHRYLMNSEVYPIPATYNPYNKVIDDLKISTSGSGRNYRHFDIDDLREQIDSIKNIRVRALTVSHFKWGCRSGELSNIKLSEINLDHPGLKYHYEDMATHPEVASNPDSVWIPHGDHKDVEEEGGRKGNKRKVSTLIPVDEETKRVIVDWLRIRPDNGSEWLFLTDKGGKMTTNNLGHAWGEYWEDYEEPKDSKFSSITPHYCRHFFGTWFEGRLSPAEIAYLRGDRNTESVASSSMHRYIHKHYLSVEQKYREQVFDLYLEPV